MKPDLKIYHDIENFITCLAQDCFENIEDSDNFDGDVVYSVEFHLDMYDLEGYDFEALKNQMIETVCIYLDQADIECFVRKD